MPFSIPRWLSVLSTLLVGGAIAAGGPGCSLGSSPPAGDDLRLRFPDQAAQILEVGEAFVATAEGFGLASRNAAPRDADTLFQLRGGLHAALPERGEDAIRFRLPGGFEARVREIGAEGEGEIVDNAVVYRRDGGTSFWSAIDEGYEEWLLLDAGVARADAPAAAWEVEGATLRQQGDVVEVVDETGLPRLRVTAPAAYARGGRPITARLEVNGTTIELWADAGGEPALIDPLWSAAASMSTQRDQHTATRLFDGRVLVVGGYNGSSPVGSAEIYNPSTNSWSSAGSLLTPRGNHTATVLPSGKVLIAGGSTPTNTTFASAELYDPTTNSWSSASPLTTARSGHTASWLSGGKVLVAGGMGTGGVFLSSVEIYDWLSNTWSSGSPMTTTRSGHVAESLSDGRVLVAGGRNGTYLNSAEVYDPSTGSWTEAGSMAARRYRATATWMNSGKVLVAGGYNSTSHELSSAEVFDPDTLGWTPAGNMSVPRTGHTATLLNNGKVLVTGGDTAFITGTTSAQIYDPATNSWTSALTMGSERTTHTATLLNSGRVLIAGGRRHGSITTEYLASSELYDPLSGKWAAAAGMSIGRAWQGLAVLNDGRVLAAGLDSATSSSAQIYNPTLNGWAAAPTTTSNHAWSTTTRLSNGKVLVVGTAANAVSTSAELYDPATNNWSPAGVASTVRNEHTATVLADGKVLIIGGRDTSSWLGAPLATVTLYDPTNNTWTPKKPMSVPRYRHTATRLGNGTVLVTGGLNNSGTQISSEIYDPTNDTWTLKAPMNFPRAEHTATLLQNGNVLVVGGHDNGTYVTVPQVYNPGSNTWNDTASISARAEHVAVLLNDSRVLIAGGFNGSLSNPNELASALLYHPGSNTWSSAQSMSTARAIPLATLLGDGRVMIAGGRGSNGSLLSSVEIYSP